MWTSRPGPAPQVELNLRWSGQDGHRYRVYIADGPELGITGADRAQVAVEGYRRDQEGTLGGRARLPAVEDQPATTPSTTRFAKKEAEFDGTFPETPNTLRRLYILNVSDFGDGKEWAIRCPGAKYGSVEVRFMDSMADTVPIDLSADVRMDSPQPDRAR